MFKYSLQRLNYLIKNTAGKLFRWNTAQQKKTTQKISSRKFEMQTHYIG